MIEELEKKFEEFKNIIDILPTNNKDNRKKKMDYILNEENSSSDIIKNVKDEIELRISKFSLLKENPDIKKVEDELNKCNIVNEWNTYNTSYEKMHLDYYLYQLHRYYKEDLKSVNACLKKILESFNKVGIQVFKDDFEFNTMVANYMEKIINNVNDEELSIYFEEIYWKFPDIIKTIEISFKSIYLKYEKKIDKYYEERHEEFLKKHNDNEIFNMRVKLNKELSELRDSDEYLLFNKFKNKEYTLTDFNDNDIQKKKDLYFTTDSYNYDNIYKLYMSLFEYNILLKYNYLLVDMRSRLEKKEDFKNSKGNAIKDIMKEESKLKKLNSSKDSKPILFFKKKNDEKWLFEYNEVLNNVIKKYEEFDNACFNELIFNKLSKDSTVLEILKFVSSNYLYFVEKTKELDENLTIVDISEKFELLKNEVNNYKYTLINNIALLDERQIKEIIVDKYNLENIIINKEMLSKDNIEKNINDINMLLKYENLLVSGINLNDVKLYLDSEKMFNS